jgi:hypothetical protein
MDTILLLSILCLIIALLVIIYFIDKFDILEDGQDYE